MSEESFSFSFVSGDRTYRFDVPSDASELQVTEFRNSNGVVACNSFAIPAKALHLFQEAFEKGAAWMDRNPQDTRISVVKKEHQRAYERWSPEEDARLTSEFRSGVAVAELAELFQRQPSAIRSRLAKLGLEG